MGLFDFLRRKQPQRQPLEEQPLRPEDLEEPRCEHYAMAHVALRSIAFENPLAYLGVLASEKSTPFLASLLQSVSEHCRDRSDQPGLGVEDITVHCVRVGRFPCAVVEMPEPQAVTETYFTAAVLLADPTEDMPETETPELRYFTLEKGVSLDGPARTVLCEWTKDGNHLNYGDGPPPRLKVFLQTLDQMVSEAQ